MICFGLLNPYVVRLMLDRVKFNGTVMPSSSKNATASVNMYKKIKETKTRQTPVMIFPDFQSLVSVVRSGSFDKDFGKIVLCAASSKLLEHNFDPIDLECKGTLWQTTRLLGTTVNQAIAKSEFDEETLQSVVAIPVRPEHHFSNHKKDLPVPSLRDLEEKLGAKKTDISVKCLLKFIVYGYCAQFSAKCGDSAAEIIRTSNKKLAAKNYKAFITYVKTAKVPMTKEAIEYAKHIQTTPIAALILKYLWQRHIHRRPSSLAVAESACPSSFAAVAGNLLSTADIPVPQSQKPNPVPTAVSTSKSVTVIGVKPGHYTFAGIVKHLGVEGAINQLTDESIRFNKKPLWKDGINWWSVTKDAPLLVIFNKRRFKMEAL